jgi:tetratricopeptide (TPR) repeat protein
MQGVSLNGENLQSAWELLKEAYQYQIGGEYDMAVELYKRSLDIHPTAEAYTYLGWTYHFQGKLEEAIAQCKKAIQIDPEFGNPYNDIGAYLIEKGEFDEAVPWLERALQSRRYDSYHFPHFNLGRVYRAKELYQKARYHFEQALKFCPDYTPAKETLENIRRMVQ